MEIQTYLLSVVLLCVQCVASVEKEQTFHVDGLLSEPVTVDIHSDISGLVTWTYTNDHYLTIKLNIYAESERQINSTRINLRKTNSSVNLLISEIYFPIAPAPVTGTGSALHIPTNLVMVLALLIGWNDPMVALLTMLLYGFSPGLADEPNHIPIKNVQVEVKAPRRLLYKTINLYINGGELRVVDQTAGTAAVQPTCKTEIASNGCPHCCHGHGVCTQNQCMCDDGYRQDSNCDLTKRQTVFFSHPLDPRYEKTRLPNDDVLTLSRAYQYIQEPPYLKDPDVYAMEIRSRHVTLSQVLILYHSDGFIEEIIDLNSSEKLRLKLKRSRQQDCFIRLKGNHINTELNICDHNNKDKILNVEQKTSITNHKKEGKAHDRNISQYRRTKRKRQKLKPQSDYNFIEVPVRIDRCGYNSPDNKFVYFQLLKEKIDAVDGNNPSIARRLSLYVHENITLLSHNKNDGTVALRLPDNTASLKTDEVISKCKTTMSLHSKICSSSNLETFRTVCDIIFNHTNTKLKHSASSQFQGIVKLCVFVMEIVTSYCDDSDILVDSKNISCLSDYANSRNSFSNGTFRIHPIALFPDGKIITGKEHKVNFDSHVEFERNELAIIDNEADVKIVRISVIPKDPVPHDIYQVKLDYACATSATVIKMTVYGSDFYSNDVICRGITSCNCCILHAAGAPNAVVDHVTINVTDYSRKYNHIREMVVVF